MLNWPAALNASLVGSPEMLLLVVDDQGKMWRGDSRELRASFDSPFSGGEFIEYSLKNLGFVAINVYGSSCQLRLRPGFVGERTYDAVREWLRRSRIERVVLSVFEGGWRDELLKRDRIDSRLDDLLGRAIATRPGDLLSAPIASPAIGRNPMLSDIYSNWPRLTHEYDANVLVQLLRVVFEDRYAVLKASDDRGGLLFQEFGAKMFPGYEPWRSCAIGAPIQEQPDRAYGRFCAAAYQSAVDKPLPQIEAVDVIINCPVRTRTRLRYKRVIFPLSSPSSGNLLIGGSFNDLSIDLRVAKS